MPTPCVPTCRVARVPAGVFARVAGEVRPSGMYLDEYGGVFPRGPATAKSTATHRPRNVSRRMAAFASGAAGIPAEIALYCEFVPPILRRSS